MTKKEQDQSIALDQAMDGGVLVIGRCYAFITAAPIYHSRLVGVSAAHYVLEDAAWISDTGLLHKFVKNPDTAVEVEAIGSLVIERTAVISFFPTKSIALGTK